MFIKDVNNQGGGGSPKENDGLTFYKLTYLHSKSDDEGGGCQKSQKNDDVFYERPQTE